MPPAKKWTEIRAECIDDAAEKIIELLEDTSEGNVIYYDGWGGIGASSVLKAVAKRLKTPSSSSASGATVSAGGGSKRAKMDIDKIIHVDCLLWESKRALQMAIAEELDLPWSVMAMFNQHDEEDDFNGVEQGARGAIPLVTQAILNNLVNRTFLVVFHNGSGSYIDLQEYGVPVITGLSSKRVLWTSQGSFWNFGLRKAEEIYITEGDEERDVKENAGPSDIATCSFLNFDESLWALLHKEAEEVVRYTGVPEPGMSPKIVLECALYNALRGEYYGINWDTHATNLWVCDGIVQAVDGDKSAWDIGDALRRNMHLYWRRNVSNAIISIRQHLKQQRQDDDDDAAAVQVPPQDTSFFWTSTDGPRADSSATKELKASMFPHSSAKLRVIHLSQCSFSFASPPFLCCRSLRFLLLDHCKDKDAKPIADCGGGKENRSYISLNGGACFRKLWVLDLSYTDWSWLLSTEMLDLMADLRELNVKGVRHWSISRLRHDDDASGVGSSTKPGLLNLGKLRVTSDPTDQHQKPVQDQVVAALFPNLSSSSILKTIILDGCVELERLCPDLLPPSLESFNFSSNQVNAKIKSISFRGCTQLKSLLLRGFLESLVELDVSGTSVKTLNLQAMRASYLRQLFLLGCEKLRAILWPPDVSLEYLHIDTTAQLGHAAGVVARSSLSPADVKWYISLKDTRLLGSLNKDIRYYYSADIEILSPGASAAAGCCQGAMIRGVISKSRRNGSEEQQVMTISRLPQPAGNTYADVGSSDVFQDYHLQEQATPSRTISHYIILQDEMQTSSSSLLPLPDSICEAASTLHVHDSLSIICITAHSADPMRWTFLEWCRVERCPNIQGAVFSTSPALNEDIIFGRLRTFWASQLVKARYIWDWNTSLFRPGYGSFQKLEFLHLDNCPRLIHVIPLDMSNFDVFRGLKTLEIVCCSNIKEVLAFYSHRVERQETTVLTIEFPELRHIHLHELPALQCICKHRILAPKLETTKIRGCWDLTRLPAVGRRGTAPKPKVDCEKEWWEGLQWDGMDAGHHPSLYDPTHSRYYKKMLPRVSLLR